ncbi:hypothetical protein C0991_005142 [Blastosporella zonata]|nr:hypothetical protein C0991_005142 [Blastosporella zonata]
MASNTNKPSTRASTSSAAFKLPAIQNTHTQDVFQSIVKGRKSWKTLRGGEIVWPPELEAALLEGTLHTLLLQPALINLTGLSEYQPDDSRETRLLGRFPMRNRFISDFIFNKTGTRRTAKQVGSRLQQLRDTCGGKKLMKLLSPCRPVGRTRYNNYRASGSDDTDSSSDSSSSMPSTPIEAPNNFRSAGSSKPRTMISIDILPPFQTSSPMHSEWDRTNDVIHPSQHARPFHSIDPTVTFVAPSVMSAESSFVVYSAGVSVFSETTQLNAAGVAPGRADGALLYSTTLVPGFWSRIAESSDPTQYAIVQDVISTGSETPSIIFSAMYKFNYPSDPSNLFSSCSMTGYDDEKLLHDIQASLPMDGLYAMDAYHDNYHDMSDAETYYTLSSKPTWGSRSPSEFSSELSGYHNSDDELVLSPISTCLSTDLSHYVSSTYIKGVSNPG